MARPTTVRRDPNYLGPALEVGIEDLKKFEKQGHWLAEPKYDGMFASFTVGRPGEHVLKSRDARTPPITGSNAGDLLTVPMPLPVGSVFVGELEASTQWAAQISASRGYRRLYVFDIIQLGDKDLRKLPLVQRRAVLDQMFKILETGKYAHTLTRFQRVPYELGKFQHWYEKWIAEGYEGIVLKKLESPYHTQGLDRKTSAWMRCKKTYTNDYVLIGLAQTEGGQTTGVWGLHDGKKLKRCLQATAPAEVLTDGNIGKLVAEFSGWAIFDSGALRHAQFVRVRDDKTPDQCVIPQLASAGE